MTFRDRVEAGQLLARRLRHLEGAEPLVLGLPRGGVPVAFEVAEALHAPLDVWVVRKVGAPDQPELGMGAVAEGGAVFVDPHIQRLVGVTDAELEALVERKRREVAERVGRFRPPGHPRPRLEGRTVVLVDDGIATGGTVRAVLQGLRQAGVRRIVLATPVAARQTLEALRPLVEEVVCLEPAENLWAIGAWYADFRQVADEEVLGLLEESARRREPVPETAPGKPISTGEVLVDAGEVALPGTLSLPEGARGLVLFAHGSGSSRHSLRNRRVAAQLQRRGLATLLFDLLTSAEEDIDRYTGELRFDVQLLAHRLGRAVDWASKDVRTAGLSVGLFGSSTGAAAALTVAATHPERIAAVVSRGGRPDLAAGYLSFVQAPTLLIVGGADEVVLGLNERAAAALKCPVRVEVIPGATHLFEERGALDRVAALAADWFSRLALPGVDASPGAEGSHPTA
jgi:putative phosphoribosyl transferase